MVKNIVPILRFVVQYVYFYLTVKIRLCWIGTLSKSFKLVFHHYFSQVQSFLYKRFDWFIFNYILIRSISISNWLRYNLFFLREVQKYMGECFGNVLFYRLIKSAANSPVSAIRLLRRGRTKMVRLSFIKQN